MIDNKQTLTIMSTSMTVNPSDSFEANNTTYQGFNIEYGKTIWSITVYEGKFNGIRIAKIKPNPFRGPGKEFQSFSEAFNHYQGSAMRSMISTVSDMWNDMKS